MFRRSFFALVVVVAAMLALAAPALAGGWAVVTLDSLPKEVRAGEVLHLGFMVRQHGRTPTNKDLDGKPLKPVLTAHKQGAAATGAVDRTLVMVVAPVSVHAKGEETIRVEARPEGAVGHFVVDVAFPSDGVWQWQIEVPTYYIQSGANGRDDAAIFAPLTVLPATAPAAAPAQSLPPTAGSEAAAPTLLGFSPAALRWAGAALLLAALGVALAAQRGMIGGRRSARSQ